MKKFFTLLISSLILSQFSYSQTAATVRGELLIQLKVGAAPEDVLKEAEEELGILPTLKIGNEVSDYMRVWLFTFNEDEIGKREIIRVLNTLSSVSVAQVNHILEERDTPNDPFFGQQWYHYQANDHDIDSDLAWNITTGGQTASGDDIVVCIVEGGGTKWDVPDLVDNHWVNEGEIPNNGIDDDDNGYVDDYHGWSIVNDDDQVYGNGSHGTQVSSMIGAKGDNNVGIVGVNWDVKLMQVRMGGLSESNVITAYTYPLKMRKLYNETGGEKGAFVVAVNSSWGADFGHPEDAPLWCAMYDSLGTYGVLSTGATANNNVNVDVSGDLPTTCPSDYLIAVTNTNSSDVKVSSAGYGSVNIDLGAPGYQVYLANNNGYGNTSGTSFSSPCVAGAVALLYSVPCDGLMSLVNNNAGVAAMQVKNFILSEVDQTEELQEMTVSGGRLNVYNSLIGLLTACGSCWIPLSPYVTQTPTTLDYTIHWSVGADVEMTSLRYRIAGESEWQQVDNVSGMSYSLPGLAACSTYEYQLMSHCNIIGSEWTEVFTFMTDGCCYNPIDLVVSSISDTSVYILWDGVFAADGYTLDITDEFGIQTLIDTIQEPVIFLDFLQPCTHYIVNVWSHCVGDPLPSPGIEFTTAGCGPCLDLDYCFATGEANSEYIKRVVIGDIDYQSGPGLGYNFIEDATTTLTIGESYPITLYPGFPGQSFNQNFRVWIDLNGDGEFQDPEERVFSSPNTTQTSISGSVVIPTDATEGYTRMRIGMRYASFSNTMPSSCGTWAYGEVEDYCITLEKVNAITELEQSSVMTIYPSPADQSIRISTSAEFNRAVLMIFSADGRQVVVEDYYPGKLVDVSQLASGLYSLVLQSGETTLTSRFFKK